MIISVSRRTDIPAFFGEWFMNRIKAGYFYSVNPFNPKQVKKISLKPEDVDVFVFWTKNPKPFIKYLEPLNKKGYQYYFQITLNDYPKVFEPNVPPVHERIETFQELSRKIGKNKVIWRYDPIIVSNITPIEYHLEKVEKIAGQLKGYTCRLTISFLDFYGKVDKRLRKLEERYGIVLKDITTEEYQKDIIHLSTHLSEIAKKNGMEIQTCAEKLNLDSWGIQHGSCIDDQFIQSVFQMDKKFKKDKNQRKECQCVASIDMGIYNTCRFQCSYCYANYSETSISNRLKKHHPSYPTLISITYMA
ncbi:DUF1848 domain-containing protein [Tepidibacillus sp. LV47]|uniref:DUF1848 domain-containing protein n=1 Tax=Tepidibacillus sp. LV47 TaxID=3398228 RepID=UPI003AB0022E